MSPGAAHRAGILTVPRGGNEKPDAILSTSGEVRLLFRPRSPSVPPQLRRGEAVTRSGTKYSLCWRRPTPWVHSACAGVSERRQTSRPIFLRETSLRGLSPSQAFLATPGDCLRGQRCDPRVHSFHGVGHTKREEDERGWPSLTVLIGYAKTTGILNRPSQGVRGRGASAFITVLPRVKECRMGTTSMARVHAIGHRWRERRNIDDRGSVVRDFPRFAPRNRRSRLPGRMWPKIPLREFWNSGQSRKGPIARRTKGWYLSAVTPVARGKIFSRRVLDQSSFPMFAIPLAVSPSGVVSATAIALGMALLFFFLLFGLTRLLIVPIPRRVKAGSSDQLLPSASPRRGLRSPVASPLGIVRDARAQPVAS